MAADRGKGHTVHISAGSTVLVVPVAVGVDPDDADAAPALIMLGRGGDAARGDAVVAPQHHGKMAPLQAFLHLAVQAPVHIHHLLIGP